MTLESCFSLACCYLKKQLKVCFGFGSVVAVETSIIVTKMLLILANACCAEPIFPDSCLASHESVLAECCLSVRDMSCELWLNGAR